MPHCFPFSPLIILSSDSLCAHKVASSGWSQTMCPGIRSCSLSTKPNAWYILDVPQILVWKWICEKVNDWGRQEWWQRRLGRKRRNRCCGESLGQARKADSAPENLMGWVACPREEESHIPWRGLVAQVGCLCSNFSSKEESNVNVHCWSPGK